MKRPILTELIIWTIIFCVIFCAIIFAYSKFFVEPNVYTIAFKDIDGITKGSPVRFMGINVGHVRNLSPQPKHINVQIIVTKKDMKIPNGTVARVEFYGLGGSKSIELMPPDGSCDVGILTGDTIRIDDVVKEVRGIVEIVEVLEHFVKGFDREGLKTLLETIENTKDDKIKTMGNDFKTMENNTIKKFEDVKQQQKVIFDKIEKMNEYVEKINILIKK